MRRLLTAVLTLAPALAAADSAYHYQPSQRPDPFADPTLAAPSSAPEQDCTGELCAVKLDELKVTGIVTGTTSPMAMVEDTAGQYIVRVGTHIGAHGVISRILTGQVVVTEVLYSANTPRPVQHILKLEEP